MKPYFYLAAVLLASLIAGCGGSMPTAPGNNQPDGGGNGGGVGGGVGGPPSNAATVTLGNNFFRSDRNGSANPAVDTVVAGGKVTWTLVNTGVVPHNVESVGMPSFTSSALESENGSTYELTFTSPGSYRYNCAIHGDMMTGVIVVINQ